ncbi:ATP-dependent DNA helicase pif1 [Pelomyxa schiedti]|nr:ATP-dependent DNA helicase pif1 [Pelomyxa schiedti]
MIAELHALPEVIDTFLQSCHSHRSDYSRAYNGILNFTAIGTTGINSHFFGPPRGIQQGLYAIHVGGMVYHRCLALDVNTSPMQIWAFYEPSAIQHNNNINEELLHQLYQALEAINPFVPGIRQLQYEERHNTLPENMRLNLQYQENHSDILALITNVTEPRQGFVVFYAHQADQPHNGEQIYVNNLNAMYETLQYPLLFPYGEPGWSLQSTAAAEDEHSNNTLLQYTRFRILHDPRFRGTALAQQWVLDQWFRIEDQRLDYQQNQSNTRLATVDEFVAAESEGLPTEQIGRRVFLTSSFVGGYRYKQLNLEDAMALVYTRGPPTFMITLTMNPRHPEILAHIGPEETASTRPDITVQVFKLLLRGTIARIRTTFGSHLNGISWLLYVIEFQKRGLPHSHILIRTNQAPSLSQLPTFICAELPNEATQPVYFQLIHSQMVHHCTASCSPNGGHCRRRFPGQITPQAFIDDHGYTHYRRTSVQDQYVVPHNRELVEFSQCHTNVELLTGADTIRASIDDEISDYKTFRYCSAIEAHWRIFGYDMTSKSPSVIKLPVHLENQNYILFSANMANAPRHVLDALQSTGVSALEVYFEAAMHCPIIATRNRIQALRYDEFHMQFIFEAPGPTARRLPELQHSDTAWTIQVGGRTVYVHERSRGERVCRLQKAFPNAGERYYLRLILRHHPCHSWLHARTWLNQEYPSFQAAARAIGLLASINEYEEAFQEAIGNTVDGAPIAALFETHRVLLASDLATNLIGTVDDVTERTNLADRHLRRILWEIFASYGKSILSYGLPEPDELDEHGHTELEREQHSDDLRQLHNFVTETRECLSEEQTQIAAHILQAASADHTTAHCFFIQAKAGCGKTFLARYLLSSLRLEHQVVIACASTAFAARQYERGGTAHMVFGIPVQKNLDIVSPDRITSNIALNSQRAALLRATTVIFWDEMPMANKRDVAVVDELLRSMGDFEQIPPVVPGGTEEDIISSSIVSSYLWSHFMVLHLTHQFRAASDPQHRDFINSLGDGSFPLYHGPNEEVYNVALQKSVEEPYRFTQSLGEAVAFAFPDLGNMSAVVQRRILCLNNEACTEINSMCLHHIPGSASVENDIVSLYSSDAISGQGQDWVLNAVGEQNSPGHMEWLHLLSDYSAPPHELQLRVGALVMLMKNLSIQDGLTNNSVAIVCHISTRIIAIEPVDIVTGQLCGRLFQISRVVFQFVVTKAQAGRGIDVERKQFPLRLAYAVTIHKAQGLTLLQGVIDLRHLPFTHGQLYVAMSCFPTAESVCLLCGPDAVHERVVLSRNIIFLRLLEMVQGHRLYPGEPNRRQHLQLNKEEEDKEEEDKEEQYKEEEDKEEEEEDKEDKEEEEEEEEDKEEEDKEEEEEEQTITGNLPLDIKHTWRHWFPHWQVWAQSLVDNNPNLRGEGGSNLVQATGARLHLGERLYFPAQLQDQFYDNLPEDIQLELDQAGYVAAAAHFQFPQAQNPSNQDTNLP